MPKLVARNTRGKKHKSYNLNSLIGVHFNDMYNEISSFPRKAYYVFEAGYEEEHGRGATYSKFFEDINPTQAPGTIIWPSHGYQIPVNTLANAVNPATLATIGDDRLQPWFAPYGAATIAGMYKTYRVSSVDLFISMVVDPSTQIPWMSSSHSGQTQYCDVRVGFILDTNSTNTLTDDQLREAIVSGHIQTKHWRITNKHMGVPFKLQITNLNVIKQFDQDAVSTDVKDETLFAGQFNDGSNSNITHPTTRLYVKPFLMIKQPAVAYEGATTDNNLDLTTSWFIRKKTQLSNPTIKAIETS